MDKYKFARNAVSLRRSLVSFRRGRAGSQPWTAVAHCLHRLRNTLQETMPLATTLHALAPFIRDRGAASYHSAGEDGMDVSALLEACGEGLRLLEGTMAGNILSAPPEACAADSGSATTSTVRKGCGNVPLPCRGR